MIRTIEKICLTLLAWVFILNAQTADELLEFSNWSVPFHARSMAMGGAYSALSDDGYTASGNPAGLGLIGRTQLNIGGGLLNTGINSEYLSNSVNENSTNFSFNNISYVFPFPVIQGSQVVAVSFSKISDFNSLTAYSGYNTNSSRINHLASQYSDFVTPLTEDINLSNRGNTVITKNLFQSGEIDKQGGLYAVSASGAIEIAPSFFVGASINAYTGSFKTVRKYLESDSKSLYDSVYIKSEDRYRNFVKFGYDESTEKNISGYGISFGILYQYDNVLRAGMTIKLPDRLSIDEKYTLEASSEFSPYKAYYSGIDYESEYDIRTPGKITFSGAYRINRLIVAGELDIVNYDYSKYSGGEDYLKDENEYAKDLFRTTINIKGGVEYFLDEPAIRLRAGAALHKSPYKNDGTAFDRKTLSAGAGYLINSNLSVELGYSYSFRDDFSYSYGSLNANMIQKEISDHNLALDFSFRM